MQQPLYNVEQYANNLLEADHGRLKSRLRPMRGLKTQASAQRFASGHAFVQNLRRGQYELAVAAPPEGRLVQAFAEPATVVLGIWRTAASRRPARPNATAPFQIVTEREEKASIATGSNLPFSEWGSIIPDHAWWPPSSTGSPSTRTSSRQGPRATGSEHAREQGKTA